MKMMNTYLIKEKNQKKNVYISEYYKDNEEELEYEDKSKYKEQNESKIKYVYNKFKYYKDDEPELEYEDKETSLKYKEESK